MADKYRIRIVERTGIDGDPLWRDYRETPSRVWETEDKEAGLLRMAHVLNTTPFINLQLISIVDTVAVVSENLPPEPTPPEEV